MKIAAIIDIVMTSVVSPDENNFWPSEKLKISNSFYFELSEKTNSGKFLCNHIIIDGAIHLPVNFKQLYEANGIMRISNMTKKLQWNLRLSLTKHEKNDH